MTDWEKLALVTWRDLLEALCQLVAVLWCDRVIEGLLAVFVGCLLGIAVPILVLLEMFDGKKRP